MSRKGGADDYLSALGEAGEVTAGGPGGRRGCCLPLFSPRPGMPAIAALVFLAVLAVAVACWSVLE